MEVGGIPPTYQNWWMNPGPLLCSVEGDALCLSARVTDVSLTHSAMFPSFPALSDVAHFVPGSPLHSGSIMWRRCPSSVLGPHWKLDLPQLCPWLSIPHWVYTGEKLSLFCFCLPHMLGLSLREGVPILSLPSPAEKISLSSLASHCMLDQLEKFIPFRSWFFEPGELLLYLGSYPHFWVEWMDEVFGV